MFPRPIVFGLFLGLITIVGLAGAETPVDSIRDQGFNDAWSYTNAITVMNDFERICLPHAEALIRAGDNYAKGALPQAIATQLNALPGVRGTVLYGIRPITETADAFRLPDNIVSDEIFPDRFFEDLERPLAWRGPMLKRTQGGQVRYKTFKQGDESVHFMVRYLRHDTLSPPYAAIYLAPDPDWFRGQIVSRMDSLARENRQLLFWAASPTNSLKEQSLGVIWGADTLWWAGPKDIKVTCVQPLWPFGGLANVYSFLRSVGGK
jgi:hypothetical protein